MKTFSELLSAQESANIVTRHMDPGGPLPRLSEDCDGDGLTRWFRDMLMCVARKTLKAAAPSPHHASLLRCLGTELSAEVTDEETMKMVVELLFSALELHAAEDFARPYTAHALAGAYGERLELLGARGDLDHAVQLFQDVLTPRPPIHSEHGAVLLNLASMIYKRYEAGSAASDLDQVISLYRDALALHPSPHPARGFTLSYLSTSLTTRYRVTNDPDNLDQAIAIGSEALEAARRPCDSELERAASMINQSQAVTMKHHISGAAEAHRQNRR